MIDLKSDLYALGNFLGVALIISVSVSAILYGFVLLVS